jgi:hypothetical protein
LGPEAKYIYIFEITDDKHDDATSSTPAPSAGKGRQLLRSLGKYVSALQETIKSGNTPSSGATFAFLLGDSYDGSYWSQGILNGMDESGRSLVNLLLKVNEFLPADMQLAFHIVSVERSATQQGGAAARKSPYSDFSIKHDNMNVYRNDDFQPTLPEIDFESGEFSSGD